MLGVAVWPAFRRWAGPLPLITSVAATVCVPVATGSGTFLKSAIHLDTSPLVQRHLQLGDLMLCWGIGLVAAAALLYWLHRQGNTPSDSNRQPHQGIVIAIIAIAAVASVGTLIHVYRVGDSGARAVWEGSIPSTASPVN